MSWIKMRTSLASDPAVIAMAGKLDVEEDLIVGKLHRLWAWADQHTSDGNASSVTTKWIDRYIGMAGFASSMIEVGWLTATEAGITFPKFERHNGQPAKTRSLTANRVSQLRNASNVTNVTHQSLPEKSREEKIEKKKRDSSNGSGKPNTSEPVDDITWLSELRTSPGYQGIDIAREHGKMVEWCKTAKKQPTRRRFINWLNRIERPMVVKFNAGSTTKKYYDTRPDSELSDEQIAKNKAVIAQHKAELTTKLRPVT